jgi:multidrug efflux pump subunit AcrA (membrane-fusion protein)
MFGPILRHKKFAAIICLLAITAGGYFGYKSLINRGGEIEYATASVRKGVLTNSISGSGQVAVSDQMEVKPKVAEETVYVNAEAGQEIKSGSLIVQLDTKDAEKTLANVELDLADAKAKLKELEYDKRRSEESLSSSYQETITVLANVLDGLASRMSDFEKIFTQSSYAGAAGDIEYYIYLLGVYKHYSSAEQLAFWTGDPSEKYTAIKDDFESFRLKYFALTLYSPAEQIEDALSQAADFAQNLLELVRQSHNLLQKYQMVIIEEEGLTPPIPTTVTSSQASQLSEFVSILVSRVNSLSSAIQSLEDKKTAVEKASSSIEEQNRLITQKEDSVLDAREKLNQHSVYVPFDGIISKVNVKKGESVTTGTSLVTLITTQKIAEISFNEVDAAKIKTGQRVSLSFDALPETYVSGRVIEVDAVGQVNQGVVSYNVKITFNEQAEEVKPGMSVMAEIIINEKQDILIVSNSAVKSQRNSNYVELMDSSGEIKIQPVEIGISNDLFTEIVSGLEEGDIVVTSRVNSGAATTASTQQNTQQFQIPGMGGQTRIMR